MNITKALILSILLSVLWINSYTQNRSKKDTDFREVMWYGGSVGLGFQSFSGQSAFLLALFPMAGYKITDEFSIGPRLGIAYQHIRSRGIDNQIYKFNPIEISGALFARYKFFSQIFGHVEYEIASEKNPARNLNGIPIIIRETENNFYMGAGYNSGGRFASEIYLLYNFLEDPNSLEIPLVVRVGFTYRF